MITGIWTVKKTNKKKGANIEEASINCEDPQILSEVMCTPLTTYFRRFPTPIGITRNCSRLIKISWWAVSRPLVLSWWTTRDLIKWRQKAAMTEWQNNRHVLKRLTFDILSFQLWLLSLTLHITKACRFHFSPFPIEQILQYELNHSDDFLFWYLHVKR